MLVNTLSCDVLKRRARTGCAFSFGSRTTELAFFKECMYKKLHGIPLFDRIFFQFCNSLSSHVIHHGLAAKTLTKNALDLCNL